MPRANAGWRARTVSGVGLPPARHALTRLPGHCAVQPKPIHALARGLLVLETLSRRGSASALELARETAVPRATVYRILRTLEDAGFVGRGITDDRFHPLLGVRRLSGGFKDGQLLAAVAAPLLATLTKRISWPCDVVTLEGTAMIIRDTTHGQSALSIDRNVVGRRLPLLGSCAGLAYLAFAPAAEQSLLIESLARSTDPADQPARDAVKVRRLLEATRRRGYGVRQGGAIWPHTGAVALPVRQGGRVLGCVSVIWMARVISAAEGLRRCLEPLRETRALLEAALAEAGSNAAAVM
jgi:IclR family mhp operon transcriptional activator